MRKIKVKEYRRLLQSELPGKLITWSTHRKFRKLILSMGIRIALQEIKSLYDKIKPKAPQNGPIHFNNPGIKAPVQKANWLRLFLFIKRYFEKILFNR